MVRDHVPCPWERKGTLMRTLIEATKHDQVELVDGVKIHLGADWAILYPDPDRPVFQASWPTPPPAPALGRSRRPTGSRWRLGWDGRVRLSRLLKKAHLPRWRARALVAAYPVYALHSAHRCRLASGPF